MILKTIKQTMKTDKTTSKVIFNKIRRMWRKNKPKSIWTQEQREEHWRLEEKIRKAEKENIRLKKKNEDIKTIKATKIPHYRE